MANYMQYVGIQQVQTLAVEVEILFFPTSDFSIIHVYSSIMENYRKTLVLLAVLVFFSTAFWFNKAYEDSATMYKSISQDSVTMDKSISKDSRTVDGSVSQPRTPSAKNSSEQIISPPQCSHTILPYDLKSCMKNNSCPNIVYMLVDDVGYGDVEYNGGKALTPHLNAMAKGPHSIHLTRFYAGGPVCSPTRGTILTGRNHNRYCIWHADLGVPRDELTCPSLGPLPSSEVTIAEMLKEHGYHTSFYGKWHVGDLKPIPGGNVKWPVSHPGMNGFTDWLVTERHTASLLPNCKCSSQYSCTIDGRQYSPYTCRNYLSMNPYTGKLEKYPGQVFEDSHFLVDRFEEFLTKRNTSKPFFFILGFHSVHSEFFATPHWFDYYKNVTPNHQKRHYLGTMSALDEAIGRVRKRLQEPPLHCNTMLWFSSDNGPQKDEPGSSGGLRGRKGEVLEGGIRVPGIIEWPGVIEGNIKSDFPVVTNDLLPTVADILGIETPQGVILDGISILPFLQNKTNQRESNMKFAFHIRKGKLDANFHGAVVGDQYKYLAEFDKGKIQNFNLYDLFSDRGETTNVSSSHIDLTLSMKEELEAFLLSVNKSATEVGCLETHDRRQTNKC